MNYRQRNKNYITKKYGEPTTLEELFEIVKLDIDAQGDQDKPFVTGLAWNIVYREQVSNSHECPANGVTNWGGREKYDPISYPGFKGRVWLRVSESPERGWVSDFFKRSLTYTGTGGGGSYQGPWTDIASAQFHTYGYRENPDFPSPNIYSWDYKIFSDDYPLILDTWVKDNLFDVIKTNDTTIRMSSDLEWTDPETKAQDDQFLDWFNSKTLRGFVLAEYD